MGLVIMVVRKFVGRVKFLLRNFFIIKIFVCLNGGLCYIMFMLKFVIIFVLLKLFYN